MSNKTTKAANTVCLSTPSKSYYATSKHSFEVSSSVIHPIMIIVDGENQPIVKIHREGRVELSQATKIDEGAELFFKSFCSHFDTQSAGTGYRDAIFERLLTVCEENGGVLTREILNSERECVVVEERLKGIR